MDSKSENKLVIISGPGYGKEFYLLQGRTTIGSAPGNDVRLDGQDVSGFHAEFRIDHNAFYITDFSSENGTFVNEEKIGKNIQVSCGDIIQIGSTRTVFSPRNAILVNENCHREKFKEAPGSGAPKLKKWLVMACVFLVTISAIKLTSGTGKNSKTHPEQPAAQKNSVAHSGKDVGGTKNEHEDSTAKNLRENKIGSPDQTLNGNENRQKNSDDNRQEKIATIHFKIAKRFADHQIWRDALEHYCEVLEIMPDYPELSAQIARMQVEMNNQTAHQQGQALIKNGSYEEGIARMKAISENSFYYNEAVKAIVDVKEKMASEEEKIRK